MTLRWPACSLLTVLVAGAEPLPSVAQFPVPASVQWSGPLGEAIDAGKTARLGRFIRDEQSPPVQLFSPEQAEQNTTGRYWGEHAGKWLFAAARAAARTGDRELGANVRRVADFLIGTQQPDGYIGTYPREWRFMARQQELTRGRWDVWVTAYTLMGLLEVNRHFPDDRYLVAARRLADLCVRTFVADGRDITALSNHSGLSAVILLEPVADLYGVTGEPRYLELARTILSQADARAGFEPTKKALAGADVQTMATGKSYQLCWFFLGVARLHRVTGDPQYLQMARNAAESIRRDHLTLGGGPWGGIASHREVFNPAGFFSPEGFVETCSIMSWIQLNRELLALTGEPVYAEEIERAAYNSLLGAQDENGGDWCYYTFPNGRRVHTSEWKCCKSSGAMALEELAPVAYARRGTAGIMVNLYGPNRATMELPGLGAVELEQVTGYPFEGEVHLKVNPAAEAEFGLFLRVPEWAVDARMSLNGADIATKMTPGTYAEVRRVWRQGDVLTLVFPMSPRLHHRTNQSRQDSNLRENGEPVMQIVMRYDYVAVTRGPLVYATGLIDGFKTAETLRLPADVASRLEEMPASVDGVPSIRLKPVGRSPLVFTPYYLTGERQDGAWRLTWMQLAPD